MKKTLIVTAAALCLANAASAQFVNNGTIGIYNDAAGTSCCIPLASGQANAHVIMTLAGASAAGGAGFNGGFTGAEFRIEESAPTGYFFIWAANSALFSVVVGSPLDETPAVPDDARGTNMASAACQPSDHAGIVGDKVELGTIQILAFGPVPPCDLIVKRKSPPGNAQLADCPLVTLCDIPTFTKVCLSVQPSALPGGSAEPQHFVAKVNAPGCLGSACGFVGVEQQTWTGVKALFR